MWARESSLPHQNMAFLSSSEEQWFSMIADPLCWLSYVTISTVPGHRLFLMVASKKVKGSPTSNMEWTGLIFKKIWCSLPVSNAELGDQIIFSCCNLLFKDDDNINNKNHYLLLVPMYCQITCNVIYLGLQFSFMKLLNNIVFMNDWLMDSDSLHITGHTTLREIDVIAHLEHPQLM